jgi:hypothetical protein
LRRQIAQFSSDKAVLANNADDWQRQKDRAVRERDEWRRRAETAEDNDPRRPINAKAAAAFVAKLKDMRSQNVLLEDPRDSALLENALKVQQPVPLGDQILGKPVRGQIADVRLVFQAVERVNAPLEWVKISQEDKRTVYSQANLEPRFDGPDHHRWINAPRPVYGSGGHPAPPGGGY